MISFSHKFLAVSCLSMAVMFVSVLSHPAAPADDKVDKQNLKFTFGSKDEIPAAFFESAPLESTRNRNDSERQVYPACQDGSGGQCVDAGTCPNNLKPETQEPGACTSEKECCFGAPSNDKTCGSRGGECRSTKECGSGPKFLEAVDCDQKQGQTCCILI